MTNAQLKAQIDAAITNKVTPNSVTPPDVGNNMKDIVDYIDQEIDLTPLDANLVHKTIDETITSQKTFTTQTVKDSIVINNSIGNRGIVINQSAPNNGLEINSTGSGQIGRFTLADPDSFGLRIYNNTDFNDAVVLENNSGGGGIIISNISSGNGMSIDNSAGGLGLFVNNDGNNKGIYINNTSTDSAQFINNAGTGTGMYLFNLSTGKGLVMANSSTGISQEIINSAAGKGLVITNSAVGGVGLEIKSTLGSALNVATDDLGVGIVASTICANQALFVQANHPTLGRCIFANLKLGGESIYTRQDGAGIGFVSNSAVTATGSLYEGWNNGTAVFKVNKLGEVEASKLFVTGGLATEYLMANGTRTTASAITDANAVHKTGVEAVTGTKNFTNSGVADAITIANSGSGHGINITTTGSGFGLQFQIGTGSRGMTFTHNGPSQFINGTVNSGLAMSIANMGTEGLINVSQGAAASGDLILSLNNSTNASSTGINVSTSNVGTGIKVQSSGAGKCLIINNTTSATGIPFTIQKNSIDVFTIADSGSVITGGTITSTQFRLSALNTAPLTATSSGVLGEIRIVNGFIYICVATNTWQRAAIATW